MNNLSSPFLEKDIRTRRKKEKRTIVNTIIIVTVLICASIFYIYVNVDESFAAQIYGSPTPAHTYEITPTPVSMFLQNDEQLVIFETPTPSPTPIITPTPTPIATPFIHPADRDNKFTDGEVIIDELLYKSSSLNIDIDIVQRGESVLYIAEVYFKELDNFLPAFANGAFHNGYQTTSEMAEENDAIFAVNSDSATAVDYGIIMRNQIIYRNIPAADHLVMFQNGTLETYPAHVMDTASLISDGAEHIFCFGPKLFYNGEVLSDFSFSHINSTHPRTAIGMVDPYHYFFVVVDGRSSDSKGMTLDDLAQVMYDLGCSVAYNLDGGGSSSMVFMGELINKPEGDTTERRIDSAILFVEIDNDDD